jgi:hypothetical protein
MSYTVYTLNYNSTTHVSCSLAFTMYKYSELKVSSAIKKLSCKASYKTPLFHNAHHWKLLFSNEIKQ